jgi:hypothetical protein
MSGAAFIRACSSILRALDPRDYDIASTLSAKAITGMLVQRVVMLTYPGEPLEPLDLSHAEGFLL